MYSAQSLLWHTGLVVRPEWRGLHTGVTPCAIAGCQQACTVEEGVAVCGCQNGFKLAENRKECISELSVFV